MTSVTTKPLENVQVETPYSEIPHSTFFLARENWDNEVSLFLKPPFGARTGLIQFRSSGILSWDLTTSETKRFLSYRPFHRVEIREIA